MEAESRRHNGMRLTCAGRHKPDGTLVRRRQVEPLVRLHQSLRRSQGVSSQPWITREVIHLAQIGQELKGALAA